MRRFELGASLALAGMLFLGCSKTSSAKHEAGPEGLKKVFEELVASAKKGDAETAAKLIRSLMPAKEDFAAFLKPDWASKVAEQSGPKVESLTKLDAAGVVRGFGLKPERSRVDVYKATTEELAAYQRGTAAWEKFAGGNQRLAQTALLPGKEFYAVELREPGKKYGTKYQIFGFTNGHWVLLGKLWRALK
jgi:hypothetical protein